MRASDQSPPPTPVIHNAGPETPRTVFRPPESNRPNANVYAAKGHPELTGADLAVTYATNTYPRFVRLTFFRR